MKLKRFNRIAALCLTVVLSVSLFSAGFTASAANSDQIADLNRQIEELNKKISNDKNNAKKQQETKNLLDQQIAAMQKKIDLLDSQISTTKAEIAASEKKIEEKNTEIADTKEQFKKRLRSLYNSNTNSSVQVLLGAESFSDLLTRTELTKCISAQDNKIVDELTDAISQINTEIAANQERQKQLDANKAEVASDKAKLDASVKQVNQVISSLNSGISTAQNDIKKLQNTIDSLTVGGEVDIEFDGKFIWPCPGYTNITSGMGPRWGTTHNGIDISSGGIRGKAIVSAASGTVTTVVNSCTHDYPKYSSCGCGGGFGNHVRISHGTYKGVYYKTIYGHMKNVASGIYNGLHVGRNKVIGYVGCTGYSTGNHLHFSIVAGTKYVDPELYV